MKKIIFSTIFVVVFFGIFTSSFASTIKVSFTANGQAESVAVQQGDIVHVSWTSEGSEPILGCKGSGSYGILTMNGQEWVNSSLPTSGSADLTVVNWSSTAMGFTVYCWLGDWPQNAQFGSNIAMDEILFLDKRVGTTPKGPVPVIITLAPASGPVGTKVQIIGSGFTNSNDIAFVGSTNPVSGSNPNTVSPVNGEIHFTNVNSTNGKVLAFTVPAQFAPQTGEIGITTQPSVVPGVYYVIVQTANGKSGVSYFKVTNVGEKPDFIPSATSFVINENLALRDLGPEVTKLQGLLAKDPSLYPEGFITGYFGSLTQKAVQRFQCKYGIVCSGTSETSGYGNVDLNTRLKMEEIFGGAKPDNSQSNSNTSTVNQNQQELQNKINDLMKQIQQLQAQLQSLIR
ncbi:peptidoglycan-binding protein [Candidatus Jorgensenbacteria bacterium]|nr:peptidoglycan-binding protein [Candidatus Jorgensenbacteria bacterium]